MSQMHSLLARQLKKLPGESGAVPEQWQGFITAIDSAYKQFDTDRDMLERSLELSSQELLQANSELRAVFQALPDIFLRLDSTGKIVDSKGGGGKDKADADLVPEKIIGKSIYDVIGDDVSSQLREAVSQVRWKKTLVRFEYAAKGLHQGRFYEARLMPLTGEECIVIIRDVSDIVRAQTALQESEQRFRDIAENMSDWIWEVNRNGVYTYSTDNVYKILGYRAKEIIGKTPFDLMMPREAERIGKTFIQYVFKRETIKDMENWNVHKNGRLVCLLTNGFPIINDSGEFIGYRGVDTDITERKRADMRLRNYAAKLQRSNRELESFASVASHDLQEPLRKVQAFGDRLSSTCHDILPEKGLDYLRRMQDAAARMSTLINDLLTYSRVTTKAQPFVGVDLNEIAREVLSDLEIRVEELGAHVELGKMTTIEADPTQMRQLLQNLIGNALKFHHKNQKPVVRISCRVNREGDSNGFSDESENETCQIIVEDNGIGFEERYNKRIFGVFQRLHGRDEYEGTGVGLAVCLKIVDRHGGSITAKGTPGQGATFIVTLPVKQAKGENEDEYAEQTDNHLVS